MKKIVLLLLLSVVMLSCTIPVKEKIYIINRSGTSTIKIYTVYKYNSDIIKTETEYISICELDSIKAAKVAEARRLTALIKKGCE